jgi:hypothetical protein
MDISEHHSLGKFPQGSHDSWQFHFYSAEIDRFFSVRMWASTSVNQAWAWTVKSDGTEKEALAYLEKCEFSHPNSSSTAAKQDTIEFVFEELSNESHGGILTVSKPGSDLIKIDFAPRSTFFWAVPSRPEGVFHFPNLTASITYGGRTVKAFGYCKRYWGDYDGAWGYRFIQGCATDETKCFWTADATFGDDKYNYFKVLNAETGELVQAEKTDTYHNFKRGFWRPLEGPKMEVELKESATMEFMLTSSKQHSKLVERFGKVQLLKDGEIVFEGYGFNEVCFGTVF